MGVRAGEVLTVDGHAMAGQFEQRSQQGGGGHLVHQTDESLQLRYNAQVGGRDHLHQTTSCNIRSRNRKLGPGMCST